jgi:hypothetical protein
MLFVERHEFGLNALLGATSRWSSKKGCRLGIVRRDVIRKVENLFAPRVGQGFIPIK